MAPCDEECCSEMIDFGLLPPLIDLVRNRNPLLEVNEWWYTQNKLCECVEKRYCAGCFPQVYFYFRCILRPGHSMFFIKHLTVHGHVCLCRTPNNLPTFPPTTSHKST